MQTDIILEFLREQAGVLFLQVDREGRIVYANRHARSLTGLPLEGGSLDEMLVNFSGEPQLQLWLSAGPGPHLANVKTAGGLPQTIYFTMEQAGDDLLLFGQVDAEEQERLRREVVSLNHELGNLSRELALKNADLEQLSALKNQFLGMAAHDLRKPAGLVLTYADFLIDETSTGLSEEHKRYLEIIRSSAERMRRVIDDFLDVSMIEAGRFTLDVQSADLDDLARSAMTLAGIAAAKRRVQIVTDLEQGSRGLRVDGMKIEQVLINLLSNAVEHTPPDSRVTIVSRGSDTGLRVWVADEGSGITDEHRGRLFQSFEGSAARKSDGERSIGLGLAIARKVVEAHGGEMFAESAPGRGSVFGFMLPVSCLTASNAVAKR